jgi:tRNA-Thr(GGU) m(6)t(6)A37 methyltransferase TsaA
MALKEQIFSIRSIGFIRNTGEKAWIEVHEEFREAMTGLEQFSHIHVIYWFHENDTPEGRSVLVVHPCKNPQTPLTGVFATHSPLRPNLIALTRCRVLGIEELTIWVDAIDARDYSPLIDIKCYIPPEDDDQGVKVPDWVPRKSH